MPSRSLLSPSRPARPAALALFAVLAVGAVAAASLSPTEAPQASALDVAPPGYELWHEYPSATPGGAPYGVMADAADNVWYEDGLNNQIVKVPAAAPRSHVAYDLGPSRPGITSMLVAPDGAVWFSDSTNAAMGRLDPVTGAVSSFPLGGMFDWAASPVVGPDGAIWFGWAGRGGLGRIALDGTITSVADPSGAQAYNLVAADDGRIWYTRDGMRSLGAFDPAAGAFEVYPVDVPNFSGLAAARDGNLWVAGTNILKKISLTGAELTEVTIPAGPFEYFAPASLVAGVDRELYFVADEHRIGSIDHAGRLALVTPPLTGTQVARLTITSSNSLWYTDPARGFLINS